MFFKWAWNKDIIWQLFITLPLRILNAFFDKYYRYELIIGIQPNDYYPIRYQNIVMWRELIVLCLTCFTTEIVKQNKDYQAIQQCIR